MPVAKGTNPYYDRLAEEASRGEYTLLDPLDYLILEKLIDEGETFAGLYPLGDVVNTVTKKFVLPKGMELKTSTVGVRLRTLAAQGLTVSHTGVPGSNGQAIWQRTKTGKKLYREWKERRNGDSG